MWLLDLNDLNNIHLKSFNEKNTPRYAILSHTWLEDNDQELSFNDLRDGLQRHNNSSKKGYGKVLSCCHMAHKDGLRYCWIDTCCINKDSSAELSEAINSMFIWYGQAQICYVYLADVAIGSPHWWLDFENSRWFTRGWTLQELLAPKTVHFCDCDWTTITSKHEQAGRIRSITGIDEEYLLHESEIQTASIAARMSWAAGRETTRTEDVAYCLLGIFGINMTLLYGERDQAFARLQEEILKESDDQSLFAWEASDSLQRGIFAKSPNDFVNSRDFFPFRNSSTEEPMTPTSKGLRMRLPFLQLGGKIVGLLRCMDGPNASLLGIVLSSRYGNLEHHEQLCRISGERLMRIAWGEVGSPARDMLTVLIAKHSAQFKSYESDTYIHCFVISVKNKTSNEIEVPHPVTAWWPYRCRVDVGINPYMAYLNPLRSGHRHVVIVTTDPSGTRRILAFGFGSLKCGVTNTQRYWAAGPTWNMPNDEVPAPLGWDCSASIALSSETPMQQWLRSQWEFFLLQSVQEDTTSGPTSIDTGDYRANITMSRHMGIGHVMHAVDVEFVRK